MICDPHQELVWDPKENRIPVKTPELWCIPWGYYHCGVAYLSYCSYCENLTELVFENKLICVACMCRMEAGKRLVLREPERRKRRWFSDNRNQVGVQVDPANQNYHSVAFRQFPQGIENSQPGSSERREGLPHPA